MNQQNNLLITPIDTTGRSMRKTAPLALLTMVIAYGPALPAMAQTQHRTIPNSSLAGLISGRCPTTAAGNPPYT